MKWIVSEEKGFSESWPSVSDVHMGMGQREDAVYPQREGRGIRINYQAVSVGADILLLGARVPRRG